MDAIGGSRGGDEGNSDSEVQRTMLEIVNQLDGFDSRGNVKAKGWESWVGADFSHANRWHSPFCPSHVSNHL